MSVIRLLLFSALPLLAHEGEPLQPHDIASSWGLDPLIVLGLSLSAWLYWRGATEARGFRPWERRCYWGGWWSLVLALISPLHPMGEVLFSAHMLQHELLMLISAPLLVLGRPLIAYMWAVPMSWRRQTGAVLKSSAAEAAWRWVSRPFNAWWIHAVALWGWHAPGLFQATIDSALVHTAQHLSFLGTALLFWWALIRGRHAAMGQGMAVVYVFTTAVHSGALGALLTFSQVVWYPVYQDTTRAWGLTALEDQQLGGLIMWVPASFVFVAAGLALFAKWIQEPENRSAAAALLIGAVLSTTSCVWELDLPNRYEAARRETGGEPVRGKEAIARYGCGSCHTIPGIAAARANVGPPLTRIALRTYVAGVLANTPENMRQWILDPPSIDSKTAMPKIGVSEQDARDIVAYLYTLR